MQVLCESLWPSRAEEIAQSVKCDRWVPETSWSVWEGKGREGKGREGKGRQGKGRNSVKPGVFPLLTLEDTEN
jgi:hypothetical protein